MFTLVRVRVGMRGRWVEMGGEGAVRALQGTSEVAGAVLRRVRVHVWRAFKCCNARGVHCVACAGVYASHGTLT